MRNWTLHRLVMAALVAVIIPTVCDMSEDIFTFLQIKVVAATAITLAVALRHRRKGLKADGRRDI